MVTPFLGNMRFPQRWEKTTASILALLIMIVMWILFAPTHFGGKAAYVILSGNSMQPNFSRGDLVITHQQTYYHIDDIVAYQHPIIGYVFHRIVAKDEGNNFILKGDHNDWEDAYHPSEQEIVGKLWVHLPKLGKTLVTLRSPFIFAILILIFVLLFFIFVLPPKEKQRRGKYAMSNAPMKTEEKLLILALIAIGALFLGFTAFRRPLFNEIQEPLAYQQEATFRYTANVPAGVYDSTQISPGEPIFRKLNGSFTVGMDYVFLSVHPAAIKGDYRLLAIISDATGWKRTIELLPKTTFEGSIFTVSETLSLNQVQDYIDRFEEETGVERGQYNLAIRADIHISGILADQVLEDQFHPVLNFSINDLQVVLEREQNNAGQTLTPSMSSALLQTTYEVNYLSIFGLKIPVFAARWISGIVGIPAIILLGILLTRLYRASQKSEWDRAQIWYGSMFIEARDTQMFVSPPQVQIASLDDLAALAEQEQRPIFHLAEDKIHHLLIQTPEQTYHYAIEEEDPATVIIEEKAKWKLPLFGKDRKVKDAYEHALRGWANAVDRKLYQEGEADHLAETAYELAKRLHIRGADLENIRMAAYLHKIGLMDVPDKILEKKNKLTQKELEILRHHPTNARRYLEGAELLKPIAEAIYYQHERWDGSGYPEGLSGESIPIDSRIIAIVNTWNGLSQKRPYRDAWDREDICAYMKEQAGQQFDPRIVETFLTLPEVNCPPESETGAEE